jgi:putative aldouronate transport system substrate-binding protein
MKRILSKTSIIMGTILAIIVILIGCTGTENKKEKKDNSVVASTDHPVVLKWMVSGERYPASDLVFKEFNKKLKEYFPNTSIEFDVVSESKYRDRWEMKMATNEAVDLAWIGSDYINFNDEVKKGSFMVLDYLLTSSGSHLVSDIPDLLWDLERHNGNIYGVPVMGIQYKKQLAVAANEYLMKRYGNIKEIGEVNRNSTYTTKKCFDIFEGFLQKVYDAGDIGTGVSYLTFAELADKGYEGIYGNDSPFVIKIFDSDLQVYNKYEQNSYHAYFSTMSDWYKKGFIRSDVDNVINPTEEDGKEGGSILYLTEYIDMGVGIRKANPEYKADYEKLQDYKYINFGSSRNSIVIPKSAENPVRAMEVLNLLLTEEGKELYQLLVNGIEGEHYIISDNGLIARRRDNYNSLLYSLPSYSIGNVFNNYESQVDEFKTIHQLNEEAIVSPLTGFELDTRMIAVELEAIDIVVKKYKYKLCQGTNDNWEVLYQEFINAMKEAGEEKVVSEMQKQINEFKQKE